MSLENFCLRGFSQIWCQPKKGACSRAPPSCYNCYRDNKNSHFSRKLSLEQVSVTETSYCYGNTFNVRKKFLSQKEKKKMCCRKKFLVTKISFCLSFYHRNTFLLKKKRYFTQKKSISTETKTLPHTNISVIKKNLPSQKWVSVTDKGFHHQKSFCHKKFSFTEKKFM